ncbi:Lon-insertion domain-containing protein, partial [Escherichia coli]|uniref:Lon-insertion domain-containing protein n=1 Tax=Escherichia coli TaxID=562 RepID=UPI003CF24EE4
MVAESMGATPIPKSHFTSFREDVKIDKKGELERDGKIVANSSDLKTIINEAALLAGRANKDEVQSTDFKEAVERQIAGL